LKVGVGPVRTGVTAVFPRGKDSSDPVFGAVYRKRKRRNYGDHLGGEVGFSRRTSHDNVLARRMVLQTPCNHVYIVEIAVPGFGNHGESPRVSDIAFLHYSRTRGVKGVEDVVRTDMKAEYP